MYASLWFFELGKSLVMFELKLSRCQQELIRRRCRCGNYACVGGGSCAWLEDKNQFGGGGEFLASLPDALRLEIHDIGNT